MIVDKEVLKNTIMFAASDYYKQWKPYIHKILKLSRAKKIFRSPIESLVVQLAIAETLKDIEKTINTQKKEYGFQNNSSDIVYNQRLRRIFKDIADGVAWRLLGYNRPLMRLLSQNKSPGFIKFDDSKEDDVAIKLITTDKHVLIHDITNILRVGDLTLIDNGYPTVLEVKHSGDKVWTAEQYRNILNNGKDLTNQAKKIIELDYAIQSGTISIGNNKATLASIDVPIYTYHDKLKSIIDECLIKGISSAFFDKLIFIRAYKIDSIMESINLPFDRSKYYFRFSSLDTLYMANGEVYRNKIPYSSYPFDDEIIMKILSGEIIVESYINLHELFKTFKRSGWTVKNRQAAFIKEFKNKQGVNYYKGSKLFEDTVNTTMAVISKDGFNIEVRYEHIGQIVIDFLKPNFIIDSATYIRTLTEKSRRNGYIGIGYVKEKDIWV